MTTGAWRDEEVLRVGLGRWLAAHPDLAPGASPGRPPLEVVAVSHAGGGQANETVMVELAPDHPGMVVRLPPRQATFFDYDLRPQARMQNAVAAAGVPAPAPALVVEEPEWIGTPFLVMPRVSGVIPGPAPLLDEWIASVGREGQRRIQDGLIDTLVAVHAVDWERHDLSRVFRGVSLADALDHWASYVEWAGEGDPLPALVEALAWCRRHQPPESPTPAASTVPLWGDARLGNLVFDTSLNVHAVLDWDLAGLGPREMDLGWHFGLEFMMETLLEGRLPGFATREEALERYQSRSGYAVNHLAWHEVFALVRALAINDRHQRIAGSARRRANPMGEIILARMAAVDGDEG